MSKVNIALLGFYSTVIGFIQKVKVDLVSEFNNPKNLNKMD